MSRIKRGESASARRRRRVAVILAILLLIALPLYLWPLRAGIQGLPGAAALSGPPSDPRSVTAVAQLPADVWDGLMGRGGPPASSSGGHKAPGNLTRIAPHEDEANGSPGSGSGGGVFPRLDLGSTPITALLVDSGSGGDSSGNSSGDSTSPPGPTRGPSLPGGGPGSSGEWSPFAGGLGPFGEGGGPGGGAGAALPSFVADPGPVDPPMPTPEPGTLLLVGFNLSAVGAVAWRRLNSGRERKSSG